VLFCWGDNGVTFGGVLLLNSAFQFLSDRPKHLKFIEQLVYLASETGKTAHNGQAGLASH